MKWEDFFQETLEKCKEQESPFFACFELTPFCNFKCNMCYVRLEPEQAAKQGRLLSAEEWIDLAKKAKQMGVLSLELTGGEPMTRRDFPILYRKLAEMGFIIKLRTNGYLINSDYLELLKEYRPYEISITLYGSSNDTYKKVCDISEGFSTVTNNIRKLREIGITPRITMTLTKDNASDVQNVKAWADKNGLFVHTYGGLINPVRNQDRSIESLKLRYKDEECDLPEEVLSQPREIEDREKYLNPFWMCRGFGAQFSISWDGRMTLCNGFTAIWKDVLHLGIEEAYADLYDNLKKIRRPKECETCNFIDYCGSCPSRIYSVTQSCDNTCDEICRIARRNYRCYFLYGSKEHT